MPLPSISPPSSEPSLNHTLQSLTSSASRSEKTWAMNRPYCIRSHLSYGPAVELGGRIENEKLGCGGCRSLCLACFGNPVDLERVAGLLALGGSIDPLGRPEQSWSESWGLPPLPHPFFTRLAYSGAGRSLRSPDLALGGTPAGQAPC